MGGLTGILVLLILGILLSIAAFKMVSGGLASKKWPTVSGVITRSEVIKLRPSGRSFQEFHFRPMVGYEYGVGGQTLTAKVIHVSDSTKEYLTLGEAEAFLVPYSLNSEVMVFYDPSNPENACLIPGICDTARKLVILAAFIDGLFIVGVLSRLT